MLAVAEKPRQRMGAEKKARFTGRFRGRCLCIAKMGMREWSWRRITTAKSKLSLDWDYGGLVWIFSIKKFGMEKILHKKMVGYGGLVWIPP
jgi:hypothetical protein